MYNNMHTKLIKVLFYKKTEKYFKINQIGVKIDSNAVVHAKSGVRSN